MKGTADRVTGGTVVGRPQRRAARTFGRLGVVTAIHFLSGPLGDEARGELVFAGDLLVFKGVASLDELVDTVEELIRDILGSDGDQVPDRVEELQQRFRRDREAKRLFASTLEDVGVDVERAYWDWLHLRVQPGGNRPVGWDSGTLGCHRDTWSSNVYAQTNWWTPIRPLSAERTIAIYPAYWGRPVANNSATWDLGAVRAQTRGASQSARLPPVPEPTERVDRSSELRIVIEPRDLLCFSGAHLHASVPNTSAKPRFSVEVRTVLRDDIVAGHGAPNLDGRAPHVPLEWFRRIPDGALLPAPAG
jgi:hypothetical protein